MSHFRMIKKRIQLGLGVLGLFLTIHPLLSQSADASLFENLKLRTIGPAVMSGRIVDLAVVEKDPTIYYAASSTGGLWKTINNGVTFFPVMDKASTHSIGDVEVHQAETNVVWVGMGERANRQSSSWGDGVYKSVDAGSTWTHMGLKETHHIGRIVLHPDDPDIVYVAAMGHLWGPNPERGLYKTTDGGQTWELALFIDEDTGVVDVAIDLQDPAVLYAAAYQRRRRPFGFHGGGPKSGLYKSTDAGRTWLQLTNGLPEGETGRIGIAVYRRDSRIVYICLEQGLRYDASTAYEQPQAGIYRSENKGETWAFMGGHNPRPMYASQLTIDPNDDMRIYLENVLAVSTNGGKTFERVRRSTHGDDRLIWINPSDSRHIIKIDDGGISTSYDMGENWLWVNSFPVSQYYRICVDNRKPFWIHGGLQDNGSWAGPSATYRREGILNRDWVKTGGGDGFFNQVPPDDPDTIYLASQYLGLQRHDLKTRQSRSIRPGDPQGHTGGSRDWESWGPGLPYPELGNIRKPANWDAPILISPHDSNTLYVGMDELWKSTDRGDSWTSLGKLTTRTDRRKLKIMGVEAEETTPSLDDGTPFWPTLTIIAESPLKKGLLYTGSDDGQLQVSRDAGKSWAEVSDRLPGLPAMAWISGLECSRFQEGTVYAVVNNYRNDDFANYLYKSTDFGSSWTSITGDLPSNRVLRTLREDPKNPDLLFVGAELGLFFSLDGGRHWMEMKNNLPTTAFNDLVIHPRDNDLVLATHGRGIWILDNIACLQESTPAVLASDLFLFSIEAAEMIRFHSDRGAVGDMVFRGENPPAGAVIDYYLKQDVSEGDLELSIFDAAGTKVAELPAATSAGINRVVWNLHYLPKKDSKEPPRASQRRSRAPSEPWVIPGTFTARLTLKGQSVESIFEVHEDPRISITPEERTAWTKNLFALIELRKRIQEKARTLSSIVEQIDKLESGETKVDEKSAAAARDLNRMYRELLNRASGIYGQVNRWTGGLTSDQRSRWDFCETMLNQLETRREKFLSESLPELNKKLPKEKRIIIK